MKKLPYLIVPFILLASCGDESAPSDVQESVRARLPLYYEISQVLAETSKENVRGGEFNVSQLAIDVVISEDLFIGSRLSEDLQKQLNESPNHGSMFSTRFSSDKEFLKRVATKGESKTVYGELVTSDLADGKKNIENFRIKDAKGKPMSAFNKSEVIIVGSQEEKDYVNGILAKRAEAQKTKELKKAEEVAAKKREGELEKARLASIEEQRAKELGEKKDKLIKAFTKGNAYEGVYLDKVGEEVTVAVSKFDPQFLHGTLEVKKKDVDFKADIKFAFKLKKTMGRDKSQYYVISGMNEQTGKLDTSLTSSSAFARSASYRYLKPNHYSIGDDSITIHFGSIGKLMLKK